MSIREKIKSRLNQSMFNSLPGRCRHRAGSKTRIPDGDVVLKKNITFHRDFCVLATRRAHIRLLKRTRHSIAVELWARPPVRLPALSQASHSHGHKSMLTDCGDDLLSDELLLGCSALLFWRSSSHSDAAGHLKGSPLRSRGRPAGGSSRSSPSAWQPPHSPSLRRVAHVESCGPIVRFQGVGEIRRHTIFQLLQNTMISPLSGA